MANNYSSGGVEGTTAVTLKSTDTTGVHVQHVNVDTTVNPTPPSTFVHGQKTVAVAGTEEALGGTQALTRGVTVKALAANTNPVFVGINPVTSSTGFQLSAGEEIFVPIDDVATIFVDVTTNGEGVCYIGS